MKPSIFVLLALGCGVSAWASPSSITCKSVDSTRSTVFVASLNFPAGAPGSKAKLKIADDVVNMKCAIPAAEGRRRGFDLPYQIAFCDDRVADAGYSVELRGGGITGRVLATVYAKRAYGNKVVDQLMCGPLKSGAGLYI